MPTRMSLLEILDLKPVEPNLFRGSSPATSFYPLYGGQLIGQSMVAASRTVEGRMAHSLHACFLRPGDPKTPIEYRVEALRDGKSYSTRRVTANQHGMEIVSVMASFHAGEEGVFLHRDVMPDVPPPEDLTAERLSGLSAFAEMPERFRRWYEPDRVIEPHAPPIELRPIDMGHYAGRSNADSVVRVWMRVAEKLPDDPALHICALAYASDWPLLDAVTAPHSRTIFDGRLIGASLDHAMWFHRPFRADEWLLCVQDSPSAEAGRGLARATIFKRDGTLVASVAQEAAMRVQRES